MTEKHTLNPQQTKNYGAAFEEPSGRSLRDGLSAAPSPVEKSWMTVERAGRLFFVVIALSVVGTFAFLVWAIATHGR